MPDLPGLHAQRRLCPAGRQRGPRRQGEDRLQAFETATRTPTSSRPSRSPRSPPASSSDSGTSPSSSTTSRAPRARATSARATSTGLAHQIPGLNLTKWQSDRSTSALATSITTDEQTGTKIGVQGTPTLIIPGPREGGAAATARCRPTRTCRRPTRRWRDRHRRARGERRAHAGPAQRPPAEDRDPRAVADRDRRRRLPDLRPLRRPEGAVPLQRRLRDRPGLALRQARRRPRRGARSRRLHRDPRIAGRCAASSAASPGSRSP